MMSKTPSPGNVRRGGGREGGRLKVKKAKHDRIQKENDPQGVEGIGEGA